MSSLYTIPAEKSFIDVLAQALLDKYPHNLAKCLVLLPSRRACTALQDALLRATNGAPLLLPRIQPIGDADIDILMPEEIYADSQNIIPPAMSSPRRIMLLAREIQINNPKINSEHAVGLAESLANLLDDMQRAQIPPEKLKHIVPEEFAKHWQVSLDFLTTITHRWPEILQQEGKLDNITRRNLMLNLLAKHWQAHPPTHPIIAAGSTGSQLATAQLLKVISQSQNGIVILPGLDQTIGETSWQNIDVTHPQYGLKSLLEFLDIPRKNVQIIDFPQIKGCKEQRLSALREIMLPAEETYQWSKNASRPESNAISAETFNNFQAIKCQDSEAEAQIISLIMRKQLEIKGATAALVTNDQQLAQTIIIMLRKFGIEIDNSAGSKLLHSPAAIFLMLVEEVCSQNATALSLLSLLLHPLCVLEGMENFQVRRAARNLNKTILRQPNISGGFAQLRTENCVAAIEQAVAPFLQLLQQPQASFAQLLKLHIQTAEKLSAANSLWQNHDGSMLAETLAQLNEDAPILGNISPRFYAKILSQFLSSQKFRSPVPKHPRLRILSPLESRLQHYDLVILAGLNEGIWPASPTADPWVSRQMRKNLGLIDDAQAVGQAAHDFQMLCMSPKVILTRAEKQQGTPAIPSRWWLRLESWMANMPQIWENWQQTSQTLENIRQAIAQKEPPIKISQPTPKPPLSARPRQLSVTRIETLMRNPYAIYADKILRLKKLPDLAAEPDMAVFGNIIHKTLELFTKTYPDELPLDAIEKLQAYFQIELQDWQQHTQVRAFWIPRFAKIAEWFVEEEQTRRKNGSKIEAERQVEWAFVTTGGRFTLTARIDRIEHIKNIGVIIGDYKTGGIPKIADVQAGIACQLPLSGWLLENYGEEVINLEYWKFSGGKSSSTITNAYGAKDNSTKSLISQAQTNLMELIKQFDHPDHPYLSCPNPEFPPPYNDYEHLARQSEWSGGG